MERIHKCEKKPEREKSAEVWFSSNDNHWKFTDRWLDVETFIFYCPFCGKSLDEKLKI